MEKRIIHWTTRMMKTNRSILEISDLLLVQKGKKIKRYIESLGHMQVNILPG